MDGRNPCRTTVQKPWCLMFPRKYRQTLSYDFNQGFISWCGLGFQDERNGRLTRDSPGSPGRIALRQIPNQNVSGWVWGGVVGWGWGVVGWGWGVVGGVGGLGVVSRKQCFSRCPNRKTSGRLLQPGSQARPAPCISSAADCADSYLFLSAVRRMVFPKSSKSNTPGLLGAECWIWNSESIHPSVFPKT